MVMASHNYSVVRKTHISPEKTKEYITRFGSDERVAKGFFAMECDYADMDELLLVEDNTNVIDRWVNPANSKEKDNE